MLLFSVQFLKTHGVSDVRNIWNMDGTRCQTVPKEQDVIGAVGEACYQQVVAEKGKLSVWPVVFF